MNYPWFTTQRDSASQISIRRTLKPIQNRKISNLTQTGAHNKQILKILFSASACRRRE